MAAEVSLDIVLQKRLFLEIVVDIPLIRENAAVH